MNQHAAKALPSFEWHVPFDYWIYYKPDSEADQWVMEWEVEEEEVENIGREEGCE